VQVMSLGAVENTKGGHEFKAYPQSCTVCRSGTPRRATEVGLGPVHLPRLSIGRSASAVVIIDRLTHTQKDTTMTRLDTARHVAGVGN
jgi:hypothetical protein